MKLTEKQLAFCVAYVGECALDASAAYRVAYPVENMSEVTVRTCASRLLRSSTVAAEIEKRRQRVADKFEIAAVQILRTWWEIATADPNELIQAQRRCCRHCYGIGHEYQWRDAQEWAEAVAAEMEKAELRKKPARIPSDAGGFGFNHTLAPVEACGRCRGDGNVQAIVMDTRDLSPSARLLYAGVKQTRDGIEIKMRDQDAALANIAKALGMFGTENAPPGGNVAFNFTFNGKTTAAEATKLYKQLMG